MDDGKVYTVINIIIVARVTRASFHSSGKTPVQINRAKRLVMKVAVTGTAIRRASVIVLKRSVEQI